MKREKYMIKLVIKKTLSKIMREGLIRSSNMKILILLIFLKHSWDQDMEGIAITIGELQDEIKDFISKQVGVNIEDF